VILTLLSVALTFAGIAVVLVAIHQQWPEWRGWTGIGVVAAGVGLAIFSCASGALW
jgi:hypothetical protein